MYRTSWQLLQQIRRSVIKYYVALTKNNIYNQEARASLSKFIKEYDLEQDLIKVKLNTIGNITFSTRHCTIFANEDSPWKLLGMEKDSPYSLIEKSGRMEVENRMLVHELHSESAFLYINIVHNSYINGKLSRNLSILPLYNREGGSYYEFNNPIYVPILIKEFSDILLEIRDMNGNHVPFKKGSKTVISLHLKKL